MRIALIHGNDGSDVRVGKTCRTLMRLGHEAHFIGWDRRPGSRKDVDLGGACTHVMQHETLHGRGSLIGQARFLAHITRTLREVRPRVVCAVNEELACAVLPLKGIFYDRLVCDVFDSLGARASTRGWSKRFILKMISTVGSVGADRLIATDENRQNMLGRFARKSIVIENVPEDPGEGLAKLLPRGPIKVWAAGSLEAEKGLPQLLEVIERLPEVRVVSAGWPYDAFASDVFIKHPQVEFHGIVTSRRALELAASCDAVFSYYAPIHEYRTNASPNKVYDAMAVGRPVLMNREVRMAEWVRATGVGEVCAYTDVECLRDRIADLARRRESLPEYVTWVRKLFLTKYHWGLMEVRLADLYREFEHDRRG